MNEAKVPIRDDGKPVESLEEKQVRRHDEAEQFGLEPTHSEDVVLGAEIGGVGGAVTGAIAGSALGLPGAITGAVIGGVIGAAGSAAAVSVVDRIDDDSTDEEVELPEMEAATDEQVPLIPSDIAASERPMIPRKEMPENPAPPPVELDPNNRAKRDETFPDTESADATGFGRRRPR